MGVLDGKVALVTGAGRGIGRGYALALAKEGAKVVVNDVGTARDEMTKDKAPAEQVVSEIKEAGGKAIADYTNVTDFNATEKMIARVIEEFGELNILVNNAGILRDRMLVNMTEAEWDTVMAVHLKGTFNCTRHAAAYWRKESKAGTPKKASVINVVSDAGLLGNPGQCNYGSAKAGIAAFTIITSSELSRYGVRVNAICPIARTRLTAESPGTAALMKKPPEGEFDAFDPLYIAPVLICLASDEAEGVTGRVFHVMGGRIDLMDGWGIAGSVKKPKEEWTVEELPAKIKGLTEGVKVGDMTTRMMEYLK
jgi:NAD(P)-dependent dehydrogenase (short-subunit alcohol dehydrogenase family)